MFVSPDPVDPGRHVGFVPRVTASRPLPFGVATVVAEIYDPSGQRVAQDGEGASFVAPSRQSNAVLGWDVPATAATGRYTVAVFVFNSDRSLLYSQSAQAGTFVVGSAPPPPPPPPPGPLAFTVGTAVVTPNPVAPGGAVRIDVPVTANAVASAILVDLGLYGPGGGRVLQRVFSGESFAAGQARTFSWTIDPVTLAAGTYTVKTGVFTANWGSLFTWVDQAGTFSVGSGTPPPPGPLTFTIGNAVVAPNPVSAGQTVRLDVPVTASAAASSILVDLELYNGAGTKVLQTVLTGQSFTAGHTRTYPWTIGPVSLPAGTYTVRAGIFNADWSTLYTWDGDAGTLTVR
jgi:acyl dehydratase